MQYLVVIFLTILLPNLTFSTRIVWDRNAQLLQVNEISGCLTLSNDHLIFPGTKWCGPGNISDSDNDFGRFRRTDQCCFHHDSCPETIEAFQTEHDLFNPTLITRLHCDCDMAFRKCLYNAKDEISSLIGTIYFDLLRPKCFRLDYAVIGCKKYSNSFLFGKRCVEYIYDENSKKYYQLFDVPFYR